MAVYFPRGASIYSDPFVFPSIYLWSLENYKVHFDVYREKAKINSSFLLYIMRQILLIQKAISFESVTLNPRKITSLLKNSYRRDIENNIKNSNWQLTKSNIRIQENESEQITQSKHQIIYVVTPWNGDMTSYIVNLSNVTSIIVQK